MKMRRTMTTITATIMVCGVSSQVASAAPVAAASPTSSSINFAAATQNAQLTDFASGLSALQRMPLNLQNRAPSDPAVQAWIKNNIPNSVRRAGPVTPQFSLFSCGFAIAQFALTVGLPVSKLITIAREAGGFATFARYVFDFVRNGTLPANGSSELIDLLLSITGVGGLAACL